MPKREIITASPKHEASFREAFELWADLKGYPEWEDAFEYAATYKLYPDELNAVGAAIVRKAIADRHPSDVSGNYPEV